MINNLKFEIIDNWPCARRYVGETKTTVSYRLLLSKPKPDWIPQELWDEAIKYDNETMF